MKIVSGLDAWHPGLAANPVFTVGVFDGVHRGHRQLLYELGNWARAADGAPGILTFSRHPLKVLRDIDVPQILTLENRLVELERNGVAVAVVIDFAAIRELTAERFLKDVVRDRLSCRRFLLGFDSAVGKDRTGDAGELVRLGTDAGVEVRIASKVLDQEGNKIGSSAIRAAVRNGDLARAANLLGRPFSLRGPVVRGEGRGANLGAATANVSIAGCVLPPDGVYLVRVFRGETTAAGVANLGVRPTFEDGRGRTLEVHVPGWVGEMYGDLLEVRFGRRLRPEIKFENADALRAQIRQDLEALAQAVEVGEV
ncbi:MAG: riboflavin biosynthesis protein RibF [Planctomycetota bacterium]|nr:riboflavin biosynthesis protein RibF [Planctomycetota bacterium]